VNGERASYSAPKFARMQERTRSQVSISPTFYKQLLLAQFPKAQKIRLYCLFALFGSVHVKAICKYVGEIDPRCWKTLWQIFRITRKLVKFRSLIGEIKIITKVKNNISIFTKPYCSFSSDLFEIFPLFEPLKKQHIYFTFSQKSCPCCPQKQ